MFQQKAEICLKRINEIPSLLNPFVTSTENYLIHAYITPNETEREKAAKSFRDTALNLERILLIYGSQSSIRVFGEMKRQLGSTGNDTGMKVIDLFALLMLLCAQIRQDLTGEPVDFNSFLDLFLPEMVNKEETHASAKRYIRKLRLSKLFLRNCLIR